MGLRTLKEAKIRLKHQLSLIKSRCDGARAQLETWGHQRWNHKTCPGAGLPSWRLLVALHQDRATWSWVKLQFICLSLNRTNSVARWYKITRCITAIIMPFIKIGRLSQTSGFNRRLVGESLGNIPYPKYFLLRFIKLCCRWFDDAKWMMIWPYYVSQSSSGGDLLIAFVFVRFFVFFCVDSRDLMAPHKCPTRLCSKKSGVREHSE